MSAQGELNAPDECCKYCGKPIDKDNDDYMFFYRDSELLQVGAVAHEACVRQVHPELYDEEGEIVK